RLYNNLSALRVTVYSIHGGEQGGGPTSPEDSGSTDTMMTMSTDIGQLMEAGNSRELAQRTGGLYFKVNPSLARQLDDVVRDLDDYYSLGYKPTGAPGQARRIKVKVNVDGARVRHRETVRERTRTEKAAGVVVASMVQPQPRVAQKISSREPVIPPAVATAANPLGVAVQTDRPIRHGWDHLLAFNFSINLDALSFARRGNEYRADFAMHFALVGADGSVYPLESREQTLRMPAAEMPKGPGNLVSYAWHVDVSPLRISAEVPANQKGMRLTVTVEDRGSGTRSVVTVPLGKELQSRG
ncbi:MAG TPA: hypothetical protein VMS56_07205, partial [Thermoanaerobaculia bacterium]|nr:hypothetical protein [Thermoanaerobaculia bacterium]